MATWRRKAAELLPELWHDESSRETVYLFLFDVLEFAEDAHRREDDDALDRAYTFTRWCLRQGGDLLNAAAVAFYEHLFDAWDIHPGVLQRLDAADVRACWPLWEARLPEDRLTVLRRRLPR